MRSQTFTLHAAGGLHARPATQLVLTARRFRADILVESAGRAADAKSILDLLLLGASHEAPVTVRVQGEDADDALAAVSNLFRGWASEARRGVSASALWAAQGRATETQPLPPGASR